MKKIPLVLIVVMTSLTLVSCGKKASKGDVTITPNTEIESKEQSAKVCAPFIKYLECSLEKATDAKKAMHQKILDETKKKIENDAPARIAQQCDTYIKILKENPDVAFKNGCTLEETPAAEPKK